MMKSYVEDKISSTINHFKENYNVLYTREEALRVRSKYPGRIPIIVNRSKNAGVDVPDIDKHKFLVPSELNMGQFQYVIRKRLALTADKALFIFVNGDIAPSSSLVSTIYDQYRDEETQFLYVTYAMENTFG